jgi:DNA (cytosine-5)-methyltransferase 1
MPSQAAWPQRNEFFMPMFYEFFAGGGMARAGLGTQWHCAFANDISPKKAEVYRVNWGTSDLYVADVFDVNTGQLPGHADMAWGSFPCQDLSLAGLGQGLDGSRSGAFWGFWALIQGLAKEGRKPRMVVLENVCGTLTSHGGQDFEQIVRAVVKAGYLVGAMVIDAAAFVPQSRPRLFVIGVDANMQIPSSVMSMRPSVAWHPESVTRAFDGLPNAVKNAWRWWSPPTVNEGCASLSDIVEDDAAGTAWHKPAETQAILAMMNDVHRKKVRAAQRAACRKVGTIYKRTRAGVQRAEVRFDGVAGCLRTPGGGSSRQTIMVVDGDKVRTRLIAAREAARLMGLPENYQLPERYNDAYHVLGDGVVVPVVSYVNQHILAPILQANLAFVGRPMKSLEQLRA